MGKWVIYKPYPKYLGNIQTLPNYLLPIKNWVLPRIIGSGRVGYPLPNVYGHPYPQDTTVRKPLYKVFKSKTSPERTPFFAKNLSIF